VIFDIFSI